MYSKKMNLISASHTLMRPGRGPGFFISHMLSGVPVVQVTQLEKQGSRDCS